jgi:hypothetical protein
MQSYDIYYFSSRGSLCCKFSVQCSDNKRASVLAHAMRPDFCKGVEVWSDETLVYARIRRFFETEPPYDIALP